MNEKIKIFVSNKFIIVLFGVLGFILLIIFLVVFRNNQGLQHNNLITTPPASNAVSNNSQITVTANVTTFRGKLYNYSINYDSTWNIKSSGFSSENVESLILVTAEPKLGFNMSVYPQANSESLRQDYVLEKSKTIIINSKSYTTSLYEPADWSGMSKNNKIVIIDTHTNPDYVINSNYDSNKDQNGWEIINNIATSLKF